MDRKKRRRGEGRLREKDRRGGIRRGGKIEGRRKTHERRRGKKKKKTWKKKGEVKSEGRRQDSFYTLLIPSVWG